MRKLAIGAVGLLMLGLFAYTIARFPNGPVFPCGGAYCTARTPGVIWSAEEYRAYKEWERVMFFTWPLGLLVLYLLNRSERRR